MNMRADRAYSPTRLLTPTRLTCAGRAANRVLGGRTGKPVYRLLLSTSAECLFPISWRNFLLL
jgi:hypothetical protein